MTGEERRSNLIGTGVGFLPALRRGRDKLRSGFVTRTVPNLLPAPIDCSTLGASSRGALLVFAWLALATGPAAAIVGGAPFADQAIARHVVIIVGARNLCTGVAIAPDLVLTAAHCVPSAGKYRLVTFEGRRPEVKDVASVAAHPQFTPRADAPDLALVKLAAPVANLTPVALSERRVPPSVGDRFIVAGFGVGVQGDRKTAGKLRAVTLVATDRPSSQQFSLIDPQKLGEAAGFGVCNGDSGGPVFEERDRALVGIVSWSARTDGEPTCGFVSGAIPLARYRYWIAETAARLGSSLEP
jgi:S1-C subfamily serine protease